MTGAAHSADAPQAQEADAPPTRESDAPQAQVADAAPTREADAAPTREVDAVRAGEPDVPPTEEADRRTGLGAYLKTVAGLVVLTLLVTAAACKNNNDKPDRPSVEDKLVEAGLSNSERPGKLRIGIYTWQPLMGYVDNGVNVGFDVEIARHIARHLGYEGDDKIEWKPIDNIADRVTYLEQDFVDLVVASFSITPDRLEHIEFAGPYLVTEQSVMIPTSMKGKISTIQDLKNPKYKVCVSTGSTSEQLLAERQIPYSPLDSDLDCFNGVRKGTFHAMTTDRTVLYGFASEHPGEFTVLDMKLATAKNPGVERLGIGISKNNPALRELVDYFLYKGYQDQQRGLTTVWQRAASTYLARLGPLTQPRPDRVPDLLDYDAKSPTR